MAEALRRCDRLDCSNEAAWRVGLRLWPDEKYGAVDPIEASMDLKVCKAHRHITEVSDVVSAEGWKRLTAQVKLAGAIEPVLERTEIIFKPLEADHA
jgi:hypothetical protein